MMIMIPINSIISRIMKKYQRQQMKVRKSPNPPPNRVLIFSEQRRPGTINE
jgi:hypothetical protein